MMEWKRIDSLFNKMREALVSSIARDQVSLGVVCHLRTIIDKGPMI